MKYAVANPARFAAVAADAGAGRFTWVAGSAELHAPGYFALGATGFTSGLANVDPSTSLRLWRALDGGRAGSRERDLAPGASLRGAARSQRQREQRLGGERGALPARDLWPRREATELIAPGRDAQAKSPTMLEAWGLLP